MADSASHPERVTVWLVLTLSLLIFVIQLLLVRSHLWPAGTGVTLSGDTVFASLSQPSAFPRIRPPQISALQDAPIVVTSVAPDSDASRDGLRAGTEVRVRLGGTASGLALWDRVPANPAEALGLWRSAYVAGPRAQVWLEDTVAQREFSLQPRAIWESDPRIRGPWARLHLGVLLQMAAFLAGAFMLVALGSRGVSATLMTLALVATAIANGGPMFGAELELPVVGGLLLLFGWIATPLAFPIIGLAVLYFPRRAPILDRWPWIYGALAAAPAPMLLISVVAAAFLLGADAVLPLLGWLAARGWIFDASFAIALALNVAIVVEGIGRYRSNTDVNERRRIQIIVFTYVPAVFAYAVKVGVPLLSSLAGSPTQLPGLIETLLQIIILVPAFTLPYAVAVKHVFSPRTVLRRSLQYALARRTLSIMIVLPIAALAFALIRERDRPLGDIVLGQPLFYAVCLGLAIAGFRYRLAAQQWLDQRFFRAEYDAREILVSLANRVPYEDDPTQLVSLVMTEIDNALHPESIAVLAGEDVRLDVVSSMRTNAMPLQREGGLATLLRWSDAPLEVFLDDERSPAARLPRADREWLEASGVTLLVPIFTDTGDARALVGVMALGLKRSEERYTAEDRKLLSGIAAQMSIALDLTSLRRRLSTDARRTPMPAQSTPTLTPTMIATTAHGAPSTLGMCPACHRCFDLNVARAATGADQCPDDGAALQPVIGMPPIVDGKYRVDAVIGRGGMGAVFRARDVRLQRDVAIKIVRADLVSEPETQARFQREAQIIARLQHPAIVTVFDYGNLPDGAAFLIMEYVRGQDLRHVLKRERTLAPGRAVDLITGVAGGIEAAHHAGVLHRDLKPENILLPASGTGPKVLDFGIAKLTDTGAGVGAGGTLTGGATILGTPAYMAPEQLRGESVDGRADVFSLAVVTYEVLTGRLPFGAGSFIDIGIKQAEGTAGVDLSGVPERLVDPLRRGLSFRRDERPTSPAAFAAALGET